MAGTLLTITPAQGRALEGSVEETLVRRIVAFLRAQGGPRAAALDPAAMDGFVRASMEAARASGVTGERGLARFAYLRLICGDGFERGPQVAPLFPPGGDNDANLDALFDQLARLEGARG